MSVTKSATYLLLYKDNKTTGLYGDLEISDIQVLFGDPSHGSIMSVIYELDIPEEIRSLPGYGEEGAYLDVTAGKYFFADGTSVSVTLPAEFDVISLLPSALVEFTDEGGNRVAADYELTYKNKL